MGFLDNQKQKLKNGADGFFSGSEGSIMWLIRGTFNIIKEWIIGLNETFASRRVEKSMDENGNIIEKGE